METTKIVSVMRAKINSVKHIFEGKLKNRVMKLAHHTTINLQVLSCKLHKPRCLPAKIRERLISRVKMFGVLGQKIDILTNLLQTGLKRSILGYKRPFIIN